jgi:hypothetical protein
VRRTLSGGRPNSKTEAELSTLARPEAFDDGAALFEVVCGRELEGIVAKHVGEQYRARRTRFGEYQEPGYWRYGLERESAINKRHLRMFV